MTEDPGDYYRKKRREAEEAEAELEKLLQEKLRLEGRIMAVRRRLEQARYVGD